MRLPFSRRAQKRFAAYWSPVIHSRQNATDNTQEIYTLRALIKKTILHVVQVGGNLPSNGVISTFWGGDMSFSLKDCHSSDQDQ